MKSVNRLSFLVEIDQDSEIPVKDPQTESGQVHECLTSVDAQIITPVHVEYRGYKVVTVS